MANSFLYKEKQFRVGDTIAVNYKIKEGDKERLQLFSGILIKIKGSSPETRMITVRKISRSGTGIERIIPLSSPYIESITLSKKSHSTKAKLYFIRRLSDQDLKSKLYQTKKKAVHKSKPKEAKKNEPLPKKNG